ncbi:protein-glutamate O-methyltransferase CheR [Halomonas sp. G15]|uniref:protein-glutamate O-methyltransferase CheR n=1 Tax=unclassified Halomonas TaxID=2609666 RepID=UPI001E428394|nr:MULTISPECIES: protein-glutamate O-methyltransferase CheR [unclassified Halomonas]MCE0732008.1 protein-glutamate O-methyltransferase CheR [Halomonas sp. G15]MDW7745275.1 protein-glutamate O-methyltransferase CheR [Halomonas sp.]
MSNPGSGWSDSKLERDLELTDTDFTRIRQLIYQRAGIVLAEHKREMVYSRLAKRLRHYGLTRFGDYLARLERQPDAKEWEAFTNALTTNLTAFFREAHHFPLLADHVRSRPGRIRVWSAAASTGEEPYSIAMTLMEALGQQAPQRAEVVATDIDTDALTKARAGVYPLEQVSKLEESRIKRFFQRGRGPHQGLARVRPEVASMVDFQPLNLLAPSWPVQGPFDAIFCRNIMIYFDKATQTRILERFAPLLKPDGLLFAGHSENFSYITDRFRLRGQTVYIRKP